MSSCDATEIEDARPSPFSGFAIVADETSLHMALRAPSGWWLTGAAFVQLGRDFRGVYSDWLIHGLVTEGPLVRILWAKRHVDSDLSIPAPSELLKKNILLCGDKIDSSPECQQWFRLPFSAREQHETLCGIGDSGRVSCADIRTHSNYGKVSERTRVRHSGGKEVVIDEPKLAPESYQIVFP